MKTPTLSTNYIQRSLRRSALLLVSLLIVCFGPLPGAQAVGPAAPDTALPGGNTADGQLALGSLTTGIYNSAFGIYSLLSLTDGNFCTGVGAGTLLVNTADENAATGAGALLSNTTGEENTATGAFALFSNTEGSNNTAIGDSALFSNTIGFQSVAAGVNALYNNTEGNRNVAIGAAALFGNTTGIFNIALGWGAGANITTGNNNIDIFSSGETGDDSIIRIGIAGLHTATYIAGISGATASGGVPVFVNSSGQLGTLTSSARFKDEIKPMDQASEAILALKPVTFRYKKEIDPKSIPQFGLVAEDVAKVNPDLVVRDGKGELYTVRYEAVNAMLLNEFLKEHRKNEEQQATIAQLKSGMEALTATVKEQAAQIQKVSAHLEASRSAPQVVNNR
jgi:Chaperone of endosialidase